MGGDGGCVIYGVPIFIPLKYDTDGDLISDYEIIEELVGNIDINSHEFKGIGIFQAGSGNADNPFLIVDGSTYRDQEDGSIRINKKKYDGCFLSNIKHKDEKILQFAKDHNITIDENQLGWYLFKNEIY